MIGPKLHQLRKHKGWSIQHMADLLGIAKSTYAGYETGYREPSLDMLRKAASILQVSVDELLSAGNNANEGDSGLQMPSMPEGPRQHSRTPENNLSQESTDDPEMGLWFKELLEAPEERRAELRKIWDIIKQREAGRLPDQHQGE
ncbi:helix-turn-helix domain-containing protein [Paenibacillus thalictri]|uniref:helix-turn-helix domain-containing protein n=1 Tax=Paenibacillus thalictri TaxID=2527873 RepID=UPI001F0F8934|nr:helix-turn-helix transcriptional regulator [Paenibacillus thalictri]